MSDTIAAISTGYQVSAIGIVRVSGPDTLSISDRLFKPFSGRSLLKYEDRKLVYGGLHTAEGDLLDICLCTISHGPNSYTGEDTCEFQSHGSPLVLMTVLEELFKLGARQAAPGEFTKRAFLNNRMDLISAEAVADIIEAESLECIKNAAGQLSGAIARKIDAIYSNLTNISAHYHAFVDYPDDDIEDFEIQGYLSTIENVEFQLNRLLESFTGGKIMKSGIPAVLAGKPNAGKSSLLNALLGYDRAIVTDVPGTTRDTIEEKIKLGKLTLRLTDTAGIRETDDEVERLGVERSREAVENAQLVIAVIDGSAELTDEDRDVIELAEKAEKGLVVITKKDLQNDSVPVVSSCGQISVSSVTGEGLDKLNEEIEKLFPIPTNPAGEILTNARQAEAVRKAHEYIISAKNAISDGLTPDVVLTETEGAMRCLGELSGKTVTNDITEKIFDRFCVGK